MPVKPNVNMLCSHISHMAFLFVWRDSGVTQKQGFNLNVDVTGKQIPGQTFRGFPDRAPLLLDGTYDFLSGLHHEPYYYRARGDKRFIYIAQAQNDWDDSVVATQEIKSANPIPASKNWYCWLQLCYDSHNDCLIGKVNEKFFAFRYVPEN